jgi:pyruvate dehydrogenase (quinone)
MKNTAADILIETIMDWGVDTIFGLPGDGINGIIEALRVRKDKIRFIQVRHEESAAFMACAYAKYTGKLGVCLATSGPGGLHLLNGLYDAKLDGQSVLAITGLQFHDLIHTYTQQDVELDKIFEDVCVYNTRIMGADHVENVTDLACRSAITRRGVSHITFPVDLQTLPFDKKRASKRNVLHHTSDVKAFSIFLPPDEDVVAAAALLNKGKKIAILAGRGALDASNELEKVAEILGAPIIKALLGKACVPDDSPYTTGGIGLLGTRPSMEAMEHCDTLLMVGTSFPYIEYLPKHAQAKAVQIEIDPMRIGLRYPVEVGLVGDCRKTLRKLIPLLKKNTDRAFLQTARDNMKKWIKLMDERHSRMDMPMKPQVVAYELGKRLRSDAIVSADSGTVTAWWARHIPVKKGQMHSVSGNLASMANGLPYAIAAQIAYPERECIAFVGDGGFSMLMGEFVTAVKYKLPIKVIIIKNNTLGQIKWEQIVFMGNPEYVVELEPIDFAKFAEACGAKGFTITDPKTCGSMMEMALNTPGPVIVEAVVDPYEPPMPPKIDFVQARHFVEAMARGEANGGKILQTVLEDKIRELL